MKGGTFYWWIKFLFLSPKKKRRTKKNGYSGLCYNITGKVCEFEIAAKKSKVKKKHAHLHISATLLYNLE